MDHDSWNFGDNTEPLILNNKDFPVTHTYGDNGNYTVTLTVIYSNGAATTKTLDVTL